MNYYKECNPNAAAWLRELIKAGLIPTGDVDERSVVTLQPDDLRGYTQCHFFAGIGGWSFALQLAGWPSNIPVWTGSCPCQPFSTAGKRLAQADERHLWPVFFDLIRQCRPEHVFGEQVASAIGHGWLDGVSSDLEAEGYACGAAVLGAHSVSSPHQRQRLYWVADAGHMRGRDGAIAEEPPRDAATGCGARMDNSKRERLQGFSLSGSIDSGNGLGERVSQPTEASSHDYGCSEGSFVTTPARHGDFTDSAGFWSGSRLIPCRDGKARRIPTEPAFFPLAHGIPARVVRLRGYGNAIVPQVAAEFIKAFRSVIL